MSRISTFEARLNGLSFGAETTRRKGDTRPPIIEGQVELVSSIQPDGTEKPLPEPIIVDRLDLTSFTFNEGSAKNAVGTRLSTPVK